MRWISRRDAHAPAHSTALGVFALAISISAFGGSLGLIFGFLDLHEPITSRLPLESPVLAGVALALIVALPSLVLAVCALTHNPHTGVVSVCIGLCIIGWIVVQVFIIRQFSFFQPLYFVIGLILIRIGRRRLRN